MFNDSQMDYSKDGNKLNETLLYNATCVDSVADLGVLMDSDIVSSRLNRVQVFDSHVEDSMLESVVAGYSNVKESYLKRVHLYCAGVRDSTIEECIVQNAKVRECRLTDAHIAGGELVGVTAEKIFVHRGKWHRSPLYEEVAVVNERTGEMKVFHLSECTDGHIDIDCMCHPYAKWLGGAGDRWMRINGYSQESADLVKQAVRKIRDEVSELKKLES